MGGKECRVGAAVFRDWARKMQKIVSLKRRIWLVPVANLPTIDMTRWGPFAIDAASIDEWPLNVDPDGVRCFDTAVPQVELGAGVFMCVLPPRLVITNTKTRAVLGTMSAGVMEFSVSVQSVQTTKLGDNVARSE